MIKITEASIEESIEGRWFIFIETGEFFYSQAIDGVTKHKRNYWADL